MITLVIVMDATRLEVYRYVRHINICRHIKNDDHS